MDSITGDDVGRAVQTLRDVMKDPKSKAADRIAAARELLDRAVGRTTTAAADEGAPEAPPAFADVDLRNLTRDELEALRNILAAACRRAGHPVGDADSGGD